MKVKWIEYSNAGDGEFYYWTYFNSPNDLFRGYAYDHHYEIYMAKELIFSSKASYKSFDETKKACLEQLEIEIKKLVTDLQQLTK